MLSPSRARVFAPRAAATHIGASRTRRGVGNSVATIPAGCQPKQDGRLCYGPLRLGARWSGGEALDLEIVVEPAERLARALAERFAVEGARAIAARGRFACALCGGSVASACFPHLAGTALDWSRVDVYWADERCVPPGDPESNYGTARRLLLDRVPSVPSRIHRIAADSADPVAAAARYEADLLAALGVPPRLDLALLGVGPDGHVASLFPGHPALDESDRWVLAISDAPKPPPRRITLTLPAFACAREVWVAAFGGAKALVVRQAVAAFCGAKALAVREAVEDPTSSLPLARVLSSARRAVLHLDPEAASLLAGR